MSLYSRKFLAVATKVSYRVRILYVFLFFKVCNKARQELVRINLVVIIAVIL